LTKNAEVSFCDIALRGYPARECVCVITVGTHTHTHTHTHIYAV